MNSSSTNTESRKLKQRLHRLHDQFYNGKATVFWTHTITDRKTGWLNEYFHLKFRELHVHILHRYRLMCPVYVLMPDHVHLIWQGISPFSNQLNATKYFRRFLNQTLPNTSLQSQAYDHVLRERELETDSFQQTASYILNNPVRAQLTDNWRNYPYLGCSIPGYFDIDPTLEKFWSFYWKTYNRLLSEGNCYNSIT